MITKKYQESNVLIAQNKGLPRSVRQKVIVSDEEIQLAKRCIEYIKGQIKTYSNTWIPFHEILAHMLPAEKGTDNRAAKRIFSLLSILPLTRSHLRYKLVYDTETLVIASLQDLNEVLRLTKNLNGIPTYKMKFFNDIICKLYKSTNDNTLTTRQICDYYTKETGKRMGSDTLRKRYLPELLDNGLLDAEISITDKRVKHYYPLVDYVEKIADNAGQSL